MKKTIMVLFGLTAITSCTSCSNNKTQAMLQNTLTQEWKTFSQGKTNFTGGIAMQIISPKGKYFISSDMGDKVSNTTHFRAASCTKTFTAAAIMLLQQQGKLNIDDKITKYLPNTSNFNIPYKNQITIKMLLMHRAGIFDISNQTIPRTAPSEYKGQSYIDYKEGLDPNHQFTLDELIGVVATNQISNFVPGEKYLYSDTGYSILGKIVEIVSGKTYHQFIADNFTKPIGLSNSIMVADGADQLLPSTFVDGYVWIDGKSVKATQSNMTPHIAEGNLTTTPIELATWIYKLMRGEAGLTKKTVDLMKIGAPTDNKGNSAYGLGIHYVIPAKSYGHTGAHAGYLTLMFYRPETNVAYVMFANGWDLSNGKNSLFEQMGLMEKMANKVLADIGY